MSDHPARYGPFGDVYIAADASAEVIADTVVDVSAGFGFVSERAVEGTTVRVTGIQFAPWHRIIVSALPQRLDWRMWVSGADTFVEFDRQSAPWYRAFSVFACSVSAIWLWVAFFAVISSKGWTIAVAAANVLAAFGLLGLAARWCLSGGLGTTDKMWDQLHERLASNGIRLDHRPKLSRSRFHRTVNRLLAFVLADAGLLVVAVEFWSKPTIRRTPPWLVVALGLLTLMVVIVCWVAIRGMQKPGSEQRYRVVFPGLCGLFFMVFLVAGQLPAHLLASCPANVWDSWFATRDRLNRTPAVVTTVTPPSGRTVDFTELREALTTTKAIVGMPLVVIPLGALLGALVSIPTLRSMGVLVRHSGRLSAAADLATVRAAVSGRGFMGRFRVSLILCWGIASALVYWGLVQLAEAAAESAGFFRASSAHPDVASATAHAIRFVFDLTPYNLAVEVAARWFWCAWAWMMFTLLALSVGSWGLHRRATERELEQMKTALAPDAAKMVAQATSLLAKAGYPFPQIVVKPDTSPRATSFEFGFLRRRRFILVSDSCLRLLATDELSAVIAHEWSHLVLGHCRKHNILQLLGRMTFVGDSFVNAIEQSFGYELDADRCAITRFGVPPHSLRACLLKLRAVATLQRLRNVMPAAGDGGLSVIASRSSANRRPRHDSGWNALDALRLWIRLYTGDTLMAYWHPTVDDRIRALS